MMKKIMRKLKSRKGESLAEVLVALLISAVSLTMLASMLASSATMTTKSKEKIADYYESINALENKEGVPVQGTASFENGVSTVRLTNGSVVIDVYDNGKTGDEKIVFYTVEE